MQIHEITKKSLNEDGGLLGAVAGAAANRAISAATGGQYSAASDKSGELAPGARRDAAAKMTASAVSALSTSLAQAWQQTVQQLVGSHQPPISSVAELKPDPTTVLSQAFDNMLDKSMGHGLTMASLKDLQTTLNSQFTKQYQQQNPGASVPAGTPMPGDVAEEAYLTILQTKKEIIANTLKPGANNAQAWTKVAQSVAQAQNAQVFDQPTAQQPGTAAKSWQPGEQAIAQRYGIATPIQLAQMVKAFNLKGGMNRSGDQQFDALVQSHGMKLK